MANRFWVGGAGTWDASSTTHWSTTSGGSGGASAPTSTDDVVFDSNAGGVFADTIPINTGAVCHNYTKTTDFLTTAEPTKGTASFLSVYGDINISFRLLQMFPTIKLLGVNQTITTNGATLDTGIDVSSSGTVQLMDDLNQQNSTEYGAVAINTACTFTTNNHNILTGNFQVFNSSATLNLGSSTITVQGGVLPSLTFASGPTINAGTSTLILTRGSAGGLFTGGGATFYNLRFTGGTLAVGNAGIPSDTNTFHTVTIDPGSGIQFQETTTLVADIWSISGASGQRNTLSSEFSEPFYLQITSSGTVNANYLDYSYSNVSGGTWNSNPSSGDLGNNTGWTKVLESPLPTITGISTITGLSKIII